MSARVTRCDREVFPIRQDMDGQEIDRRSHIPAAQPELPHVGIGHWYLHSRLGLPNEVREVRRGHIAAQQHLVAHNQRPDGVRIAVHQIDRQIHLNLGFDGVPGNPEALKDLETELLGDGQHVLQPLVGRIDPDAVRQFGELGQIRLDPGGWNSGFDVERCLKAPERRVGNAPEFFAGGEALRHGDRRTEPGPDGGNESGRNGQAGQTMAHQAKPIPTASIQAGGTAYNARPPLPSSRLNDKALKCWTRLGRSGQVLWRENSVQEPGAGIPRRQESGRPGGLRRISVPIRSHRTLAYGRAGSIKLRREYAV